jgi:hypothetical protein
MTDNRRYFLRCSGGPWEEVDKQTWLEAENNAGFRGGGMREPSTAAWSGGGMSGTVCCDGGTPEGYVRAPKGQGRIQHAMEGR